MTVPVWPSSLPQRVLRDGYDEQSADGRLFTRMGAGPPKTRVRYSRVLQNISGSITIDYASKARLERFIREEIADASLPFIMPDQTHDGVPISDELSQILLDEAGNRLVDSANWLVMFAQNGLPRYTPHGIQFLASFSLIVLP